MPAGHADHPRRRAAGHRDPAVLRPPAARAGRRVPPVLRADRGPAQARDVVHGHRGARHGREHAEHERHRARSAGREPRVPAAEPPARLPDLRPRRRVPAAGPGAGVRARRQPVRGGQAHLPQAAPALAAREPGPRTLRAVRALHAVLRPDLGRPVHRAVRARRGGAGLDRGGRGLPEPVQRQHGPDLPGGRADGVALPIRGPPVRPVDASTRSAPTAAPAAT